MQLHDLSKWSGGTMQGDNVSVNRVVIDSRQVAQGDTFLALKGDRFDGHDFLAAAKQAGAVAAVVERPTELFANQVVVNNSRLALGRIGSGWCKQFAMQRVAVTGNAGKTSVKEMIATLLGEQALVTQGNFNNDIGVPLTLLRAKANHQFGVFELGANHPGEITWTASLVKPDVALITNVTGAHLEGFGSMQGIANAKAEIFSGVKAGGTAIINQDDGFADFFAEQAQAKGLKIITVSRMGKADFVATNIELTAAGSRFKLTRKGKPYFVELSLAGEHQVSNALQAIAAVEALGVEVIKHLDRLAAMTPVSGRMVQHTYANGVLVDDTYNANPGSVKAAGEWLATQKTHRVFVLGNVGELGPTSAELHKQMGKTLASLGINQLVAVGDMAALAAKAFGANGQVVANQAAAVPLVKAALEAGSAVLVKGSRSAEMEQVVHGVLGINTNSDRGAH